MPAPLKDLLGIKKQPKTLPKAAPKKQSAEEKRKAEVDELFEKYQPKSIAEVNPISVNTSLANNYSPLLNTAEGDIGFLRNFSQTKGPSDQAKYLTDRQGMEQKSLLDDLQTQQNLAGAQQYDKLASMGGASAGARERLAGGLGNQSLLEGQRTRREGALARLGILSDDEARKLSVSSALPGQQLSLANETRAGLEADRQAKLAQDQFNTGMQYNQNLANSGLQDSAFKSRAAILGGEQMSRAQNMYAKNSSPGGILGTGIGPDLSF